MAHRIAAVILAGGQSSRMGRNKALLPSPMGNSLLAQVSELARRFLRSLGQCESSLLISGAYPDLDSVPDIIPGCGPLGGVHACMATIIKKKEAYDYLLFLPVDMPELSVSTLSLLVNPLKEQQSPLAIHFKGLEFPALIAAKSEVFELLSTRLNPSLHKSASNSVHAFLKEMKSLEVELEGSLQGEFINLNTPLEFKEWNKEAE